MSSTRYTAQDLEKLGLVEYPAGSGQYVKRKDINPNNGINYVKNTVGINVAVFTDDLTSQTQTKISNPLSEKILKVKVKKEATPVYWKYMNMQDIFNEANNSGYIFIPRNVPSLKNSKQIFQRNGKPFITSSMLCKNYISATEMFYSGFKDKFLEMIKGKEKPYEIKFKFIRDSKHRFDYVNISQICLDQMVTWGWLEDDDSRNVVPVFDKNVGYDKNVPGVIISVI